MQEQKIQVKQHIPFAMVDSKLLMSEEVGLYEKMVYCVLCGYANNNDRSCYPSYETIARKSGCSRRKVIEAIASLEAKGLVEKQERLNDNGENKSNLYIVKPFDESQIKQDNACSAPSSAEYAPPRSACSSLPNALDSPPSACRSPELDLKNYTQDNYIHPSIYQGENETDRLTELKEKIEYDYFKRNFPDKMALIDSILVYIQELIDEDLPQNRKLLSMVDCSKVMGFLEHTVGKCYADVKNLKAYFKKMFIEYLREDELLVSTAAFWTK